MATQAEQGSCLTFSELDAFVRGKCEPLQRDRLLAHVASCQRCKAALREARAAAPTQRGAEPTGSSGMESTQLQRLSDAMASVGELGELRPGVDVLGYRVQELLGRGAMGVTWRAQREFEAEPVALKVLPEQLRGHLAEMNRVKHVFDLIKSLRHPAIAMVFQLCEHPQFGPILIMELVQGFTLTQFQAGRIANGRLFTLDETVQLLKPVADALDYAHANRVVHRDVKPSNLMLRPDGSGIKLIDFGLGDEIRQSLVRLSQVEVPVAGTAPYMAPEQWRGHAPSAATDQYALACVAYELLTGHPPFVGGSVTVLRECHLNEPVPAAAQIPPALMRVFWCAGGASPGALAKSRERRFSSCRDFLVAVEEANRVRAATVTSAANDGSESLPSVTWYILPRQRGIVDDAGFRQAQLQTSRQLGLPVNIETNAEISLSLIPAGRLMPPFDESFDTAADSRTAPREVEINRPFCLARWTVTHACWQRVMREPRRDGRGVAARLIARAIGRASAPRGSCDPVSDLSWGDVQDFISLLNTTPDVLRRNGAYELFFRVPTEAEWEFACRCGSTAQYCFGDDPSALPKYAWFKGNAGGVPHKTAMLAPNVADLYDVHGNVWEWCDQRKLRGGSCLSTPVELNIATKRSSPDGSIDDYCGLRVAASIVQPQRNLSRP